MQQEKVLPVVDLLLLSSSLPGKSGPLNIIILLINTLGRSRYHRWIDSKDEARTVKKVAAARKPYAYYMVVG